MIPALSRLRLGRGAVRGPDAPAGATFGFKLLVYEDELDQLAGWVLGCPDRETGGDLLGFWTHSGAPAVQFVLGPGPAARHEVAAFYQDNDYMGAVVRAGQARHGLQQVGEWHSHHRLNLAEPSGGDARTLARMFDRHPIDRFVLCIATLVPSAAAQQRGAVASGETGHGDGETVEIGAFLFRRGHAGFLRGLFVVLPGASPVAGDMRGHTPAAPAARPLRLWSVARTTLDQSFGIGHPPPEGWYTHPEAAAFLREFDRHCRHAFAECRMSLDDGIFCYGVTAGGAAWELRFPPFFPEGAIALAPLGDPAGRAVLIVEPKMWESASDETSRRAESLLAAVAALLGPPPPAAPSTAQIAGPSESGATLPAGAAPAALPAASDAPPAEEEQPLLPMALPLAAAPNPIPTEPAVVAP